MNVLVFDRLCTPVIFVGKGAGAGEGLGRRVCSLYLGKEREEGDRAWNIGVDEVDCDVLREKSGDERSQLRLQTEGQGRGERGGSE